MSTLHSVIYSLPEKKKLRVLLSSVIGNGLEFYDFTLFGAFTLKFSTLFSNPEVAEVYRVMGMLLVFGIGFFARPIGALFFGAVGDRWGRRRALSLSIILMGLSTFAIGCLPTYGSIGIWAIIFLGVLRCFQGFCLGGENNGSAIFFLEHLKERKGLAGALILTGGAIGTVMAYGFSRIVSLDGMPDYAWRIPFLLGLFIALLGLYIRQNLPETDEFLALKREEPSRLMPLSEVLRFHFRPFLCSVGIGGVNVALAYTTTTYLHVYIKQVVGYSIGDALLCTCLATILFGGLFAPLMGHLADRFSPYRVMQSGCLGVAFLALPLFYVLHGGSIEGILAGIVISSLLMGTFNGPTNAYLNTLFPASVRYTGIAFGYALGAALFGGMAPYYYAWLVESTGLPLAPAFYMIFMAGVGSLAMLYSRKIESRKEESFPMAA